MVRSQIMALSHTWHQRWKETVSLWLIGPHYVVLSWTISGAPKACSSVSWEGTFPLQLNFRKREHLCFQDHIPLGRKQGWRCVLRLSWDEKLWAVYDLGPAEFYIFLFLACLQNFQSQTDNNNLLRIFPIKMYWMTSLEPAWPGWLSLSVRMSADTLLQSPPWQICNCYLSW